MSYISKNMVAIDGVAASLGFHGMMPDMSASQSMISCSCSTTKSLAYKR
jgi:hypothetical protein